jgi:hypothetical protein
LNQLSAFDDPTVYDQFCTSNRLTIDLKLRVGDWNARSIELLLTFLVLVAEEVIRNFWSSLAMAWKVPEEILWAIISRFRMTQRARKVTDTQTPAITTSLGNTLSSVHANAPTNRTTTDDKMKFIMWRLILSHSSVCRWSLVKRLDKLLAVPIYQALNAEGRWQAGMFLRPVNA